MRMSIFHLLFLFFLLTPVVEIYFLITVGSVIGVWLTVVLVVSTALIGAYFVKQQGLSTLFRIRDGVYSHDGEPFTDLLEGVVIVVAGALLLTPGFVTDMIGFVFLVPSWRRAVIYRFLHGDNISSVMSSRAYRSTNGSTGSVIEGHFRQEDE
uniref:UPF0716 protein FxsA n=1 Tax=Candidatus Kentrum sp. LFY TaxID=2126342 RepID=A0A450W905_9GAMM|nr:MAG: UPF0716 protein FxsA [Candidatus Kentron sp. LFY]VFJ97133.1 MAG: UPF0716 protein FxsA [Candidatus Kentron sp. LFY]VFK13519.1 MAG: UPF0716 protein FxsA [Candidatus Kentron sp. LFY]